MQNVIKITINTKKKQLYSWKTQKQTVKSKSWSKSPGICSYPQFLRWSIHCRRSLSTQSFSTLVLTGTTPLAAMDCCSSVTHAPKWLGFFRLNDSLFRWQIWRRSFLVTVYCCSCSLHLTSTVRMHSKVEWCQPISLQMTQWQQDDAIEKMED